MNIEHINNIIKKPETLNYEEDLPLVKELIESFSYFAPGYAMLTKMLHAQNSVYFDKNLHLTAAYIGDREVLYNYIYPPVKEENTIPHIDAEEEKAPENIITETPTIPEEIIEKQLIEENLAIEETIPALHIDKEESHEVAAEQLQTVVNIQDPENVEIAAVDINDNAPATETTKEDSIEEQALAESRTANEQKPSIEEFIPPEIIEEKPAKPKLELEIMPLAAYDYFSAIGKPKVEEPIHEPAHLKPVPAYEEEVTDNEPHSFQEWLERLEHRKLAAKAKTELIIDKINLPAQDKSQIDEIITTFIRKEPKIKPPQTKFFKPEDMAQQSAVEDFSFVTETLANIYLQQELYTKAIEAFRRLIDKHPDRREYFEKRIEDVETTKKENKGTAS